MEFKRLSGEDPPSPPIQSYSITMPTAPAAEGENRRSDLVPMQMSGRDSLRREIEKELIREEIAALRREIEEQVRMEIAVERELAFRTRVGGPVSQSSSSLSLQHLQRTVGLPLRTHKLPERLRGEESAPVSHAVTDVSVGNELVSDVSGREDEVLFKSSAGNILAGSKRKATIDSQLLLTASPKKAHSLLSCALCGVVVTSEQCLRHHFEGKKHKAKEETHAKKGIALSTFRCELCSITCNSEVVLATHLKGKKHVTLVRRMANKIKTVNDPEVVDIVPKRTC